MAHKSKQYLRVSKKNGGQEVEIDFKYLARKEITSVDKIHVELWVKQKTRDILVEFKMQFPELT